jgi:hypothetical protein
VPKRIKTCDDFEAALDRVRFARDRIPGLQWIMTARDMPQRSYDLWTLLLHVVHDAIAQRDWYSVGELLKLYDSVHSAGDRGEMWEARIVAFLEDIRLPQEPAELREFWRVCPQTFLREIQRDRRIDRLR